MIKYGLTSINCNLAKIKAKSKKDGVYSFRGFLYRVKNYKITHYAYFGEILENFGNFNVLISTYDFSLGESNARKILKDFKDE